MVNEELRNQQALEYHSKNRPGKIEVIPTKEARTQRDLSLIYAPGVAAPCLKIYENPDDIYKYTAKANLIAVVSNGTAVLGLGNIGPGASKPVMEGKGILFKIFADVDVFDLEINESDPVKFVQIVKSLEPTFGGINLEDIKAPDCFYIEQELRKSLSIPVMHDDQHGTAIISAAALLNALEIQKKKINKVKFVFNGSGAAAMSCINLYCALGASYSQFKVFDKKGFFYKGRKDLDEIRQHLGSAHENDMSLEDAFKDADVFIGLSMKDVVSSEMIKAMAKNPIFFAMANPDPEINLDVAYQVRNDIIIASGRPDYPNQINNVLGFPYIFRAALDTRATCINEAMKMATVKALAMLAKETVPDIVNLAYNEKNISFGRNYILPKPLDPRLISALCPQIAKAAMESGVARKEITDFKQYGNDLKQRLGLENQITRVFGSKARNKPQKIVFVDPVDIKVLKAAEIIISEGMGVPILVGDYDALSNLAEEYNLQLTNFQVIDPQTSSLKVEFGESFFKKRQRKGINLPDAIKAMNNSYYFGSMMLDKGYGDLIVAGPTENYSEVLKTAVQVLGRKEGYKTIAELRLVINRDGPLFISAPSLNSNSTAEEIAEVALLTASELIDFGITPKIALLSTGNFGTYNYDESRLMAEALIIIKQKNPDLIVDGEINIHYALRTDLLQEKYPFSELCNQKVNVFIVPNNFSSDLLFNMIQQFGNTDAIGTIMLGLKKNLNVANIGDNIRSIINVSLWRNA